MCYEERLFRSFRRWTTSKGKRQEQQQPLTQRDQPAVAPRPASSPETTRRKESEREPEEVV